MPGTVDTDRAEHRGRTASRSSRPRRRKRGRCHPASRSGATTVHAHSGLSPHRRIPARGHGRRRLTWLGSGEGGARRVHINAGRGLCVLPRGRRREVAAGHSATGRVVISINGSDLSTAATGYAFEQASQRRPRPERAARVERHRLHQQRRHERPHRNLERPRGRAGGHHVCGHRWLDREVPGRRRADPCSPGRPRRLLSTPRRTQSWSSSAVADAAASAAFLLGSVRGNVLPRAALPSRSLTVPRRDSGRARLGGRYTRTHPSERTAGNPDDVRGRDPSHTMRLVGA